MQSEITSQHLSSMKYNSDQEINDTEHGNFVGELDKKLRKTCKRIFNT